MVEPMGTKTLRCEIKDASQAVSPPLSALLLTTPACSIITIFGIVSGSSGASLGIGVMFIIGLASLCADAISMCVSFQSFSPSFIDTTDI